MCVASSESPPLTPTQNDVGTDISTPDPTAPLHSAWLSPPEWCSADALTWTQYHRRLAWAADPDSMHPPTSFEAHQVCWDMLVCALAQHASTRTPPVPPPSASWLCRFVEHYCRRTWLPLHHYFVCQREAWRRNHHQHVVQRVWALATHHGLGVLSSGRSSTVLITLVNTTSNMSQN